MTAHRCLGVDGTTPCANVIRAGSYCPTHVRRGMYGRAWAVVRAEHLAFEPRCRQCGARGTEVDHIRPKRDGGSDDHANLRTLCKSCHSRRTARG